MDCSLCSHTNVIHGNKITKEDVDKIELISVIEETDVYTIYLSRILSREVKIVHTSLDIAPFIKPDNVLGYWDCEDKSHIIIYDTNVILSSPSGISLQESTKVCPYNTKDRVSCKLYGSPEDIKELSTEEIESIKINDLIAKGGFGRIYMGEYKGSPLIIKYLQRSKLDYERFNKELCLQHTANLSNIAPKIHAYWHCKDDWSIIIMEYIPGKTVRSVIEEKTLSENEIQDLYLRCVKLVLLLNLDLNIYHSDMHLNNLMISSGDIKIIDFGRAEHEDNKEKLIKTFEKDLPPTPDVYELLNRKQDYIYFIDIPRLTEDFIRILEFTNVYPHLTEKLKKSQLNEMSTIFNIYKKLYSHDKLVFDIVFSEIYNFFR